MMRFFKFSSVCRKASAALLLIGWVGGGTASILTPTDDGVTAGGAVCLGMKTAVLVGSRSAMWMLKARIASRPMASSNDKYRPALQATMTMQPFAWLLHAEDVVWLLLGSCWAVLCSERQPQLITLAMWFVYVMSRKLTIEILWWCQGSNTLIATFVEAWILKAYLHTAALTSAGARVYFNKAMSRSMPRIARCTLPVVQVSLVFAEADLGTDTDQQCHPGYAGTLPATERYSSLIHALQLMNTFTTMNA